jgi:hypothetical protein
VIEVCVQDEIDRVTESQRYGAPAVRAGQVHIRLNQFEVISCRQ